MLEFWQQITLPYHLPLTVLLGMCLCYWMFSLLGVGLDSMELDFDLDMDLDTETGNSSSPFGLGLLTGFVKFMNGNSVPLSTIGTFLVLLTWFGAMGANERWNAEHDLVRGWMIVCLAGVAAIPLTKIVTLPMVPFFRKLKASEKVEPILKQRGIVTSKQVDTKYGQVEVVREGGAPAMITCVTADSSIPRGTEVMVESYDEFTGIYTVYRIKNSN